NETENRPSRVLLVRLQRAKTPERQRGYLRARVSRNHLPRKFSTFCANMDLLAMDHRLEDPMANSFPTPTLHQIHRLVSRTPNRGHRAWSSHLRVAAMSARATCHFHPRR